MDSDHWCEAMRFLPLFFDTAAGVVMLVGSGEAALGKLRLLRAAGAHVRWFSRETDIAEDIVTLAGPGRLEISVGDPLAADLSDVAAIVSAADTLDAQIAAPARRFWQNIIAGPVADAVLAGHSAEADSQLTQAIEASCVDGRDETETVFLVGAGPGDPDLLTLRALQALADADIVFYDELVTPGVLDRARRGAELVFVGKRRGAPGLAQDEINRRLLEASRAGRRVVRLKGGDPFIFGRGGEELDYLRRAGVPVVVVPGIIAALGCAAEVGLPLTFRNEASKLVLITAHRAEEAAMIDWSGLAD